jgi:hypothetical protein
MRTLDSFNCGMVVDLLDIDLVAEIIDRVQERLPDLSCRVQRREALQIMSGGVGASYMEILAKPAEWRSANTMGAPR